MEKIVEEMILDRFGALPALGIQWRGRIGL